MSVIAYTAKPPTFFLYEDEPSNDTITKWNYVLERVSKGVPAELAFHAEGLNQGEYHKLMNDSREEGPYQEIAKTCVQQLMTGEVCAHASIIEGLFNRATCGDDRAADAWLRFRKLFTPQDNAEAAHEFEKFTAAKKSLMLRNGKTPPNLTVLKNIEQDERHGRSYH